MNEQEAKKAVEVGVDIATYATDKLNGHSLGFCIVVMAGIFPIIIKAMYDESDHKNDPSLLSYMEMKFLLLFRSAMNLLRKEI